MTEKGVKTARVERAPLEGEQGAELLLLRDESLWGDPRRGVDLVCNTCPPLKRGPRSESKNLPHFSRCGGGLELTKSLLSKHGVFLSIRIQMGKKGRKKVRHIKANSH